MPGLQVRVVAVSGMWFRVMAFFEFSTRLNKTNNPEAISLILIQYR